MRVRAATIPTILMILGALPALAQDVPWPIPDPPFPVDANSPSISGFVRYAEGSQAGNVVVQLRTGTGTQMAVTSTTSSGRFEFFRIPRGPYHLEINHVGYQKVSVPVEFTYVALDGIVITLVPDKEDSDEPAEAGETVSVRQLKIPDKARDEYNKGVEAVSQKKRDKALRHFRKAIEKYPDFDDAYVQGAMLHLERKESAEAQRLLEEAVRRNAENARAQAFLGLVYRQQRKLEDSRAALEQAVKADGDSWFAHKELGETLLAMRRVDGAHQHLERAHELHSGAASVHMLLYNCLILQDDYPAALAELAEFIDLFPEHPTAAQARQKHQALKDYLAERRP